MVLKTGPWLLTDIDHVKKNKLKVFSCFHCGGGSTMGYKLAGYDVLGGVEIDSKIMAIYRKNHNPKHSYLMSVRDFKNIENDKLPHELFNLDILDGSPPCSSFSMAGSREDQWGEKKKFREGQAEQVLDDLFFDFIAIAKKLQPKVVVAENVKGLLFGSARGYVKEIFKAFSLAGYDCQLFLLNSGAMGVPQLRERTFFIARKKSLKLKNIDLSFSESPISLASAFHSLSNQHGKPLSEKSKPHWASTKLGGLFSVCGAETGKMNRRLDPAKPAWTLTATPNLYHWTEPRGLSDLEAVRVQSFPDDFNFLDQKPVYVCGMSVPPFMMQRVAAKIYIEWLAPKEAV